MKLNLAAVVMAVLVCAVSCRKKSGAPAEPDSLPAPSPSPSPTCTNCMPFTATDHPSDLPDSVFLIKGWGYEWFKDFAIFYKGADVDTVGFDAVFKSVIPSPECLAKSVFYPVISETTRTYSTPSFSCSFCLPLDSSQTKIFPTGLYAIRSQSIAQNCKGEMSLSYSINSTLWESIDQANTGVFYNEIQNTGFDHFVQGGSKYYLVKGRAKIKMLNKQDLTSQDSVYIRYKFRAWY